MSEHYYVEIEFNHEIQNDVFCIYSEGRKITEYKGSELVRYGLQNNIMKLSTMDIAMALFMDKLCEW